MLKQTYKFSGLLCMMLLCAALSFSNTVRAEETANKDLEGLLPQANVAEKEIEPTYIRMSYANLFRLAWAHHLFKVTDKEALDAYLKVTECNLYKKYYQNEFEWEKIRKAAISYFDTYEQETPKYYEYVQPLALGRYDSELQGFPLEKAAEYISLRTLQVANYKSGETPCGQLNVDMYKYPSSAVVNIISPLSLTFVRVPKDLAEQYIAWRSSQGLKTASDRQAFIRYRLRIDRAVGISKAIGGGTYTFDGRLMRIDVFADKDMMMPLYNQLF